MMPPAYKPISNHPVWFAPFVPGPAEDTDTATSFHRGCLPRSPSPHCPIYMKQGQTSMNSTRMQDQYAESDPSKMQLAMDWN